MLRGERGTRSRAPPPPASSPLLSSSLTARVAGELLAGLFGDAAGDAQPVAAHGGVRRLVLLLLLLP